MHPPLTRRSLLGVGGLAAVCALPTRSAAGPDTVASTPVSTRSAGRVREYWIAARNARWPVIPTGKDAWMGHKARPVTMDALVYVACTPGWRRPLNARAIGDNAGVPGPVLRAQPGDTLRVHFRNEDRRFRRAHTMHPHGLSYGPEHDGTWMGHGTPRGGRVPVGGTHTYEWLVFEDSVGVWPYHDHGPHERDSVARGLFGAIVVRPAGERRPDVEHTLFLHHLGPDVLGQGRSLACVNGRAYAGNTPRMRARAGQDVAMNVLSLGDEWHTFHIHGHRWKGPSGAPEDAPFVAASQGMRIRFEEDSPGRWLYHCHVMHHMHHGMAGFYDVSRAA
jgi:manganese oxidase